MRQGDGELDALGELAGERIDGRDERCGARLRGGEAIVRRARLLLRLKEELWLSGWRVLQNVGVTDLGGEDDVGEGLSGLIPPLMRLSTKSCATSGASRLNLSAGRPTDSSSLCCSCTSSELLSNWKPESDSSLMATSCSWGAAARGSTGAGARPAN